MGKEGSQPAGATYLQVKDLLLIERFHGVTRAGLLGQDQSADLEEPRLLIQLAGQNTAGLHASGCVPHRIPEQSDSNAWCASTEAAFNTQWLPL